MILPYRCITHYLAWIYALLIEKPTQLPNMPTIKTHQPPTDLDLSTGHRVISNTHFPSNVDHTHYFQEAHSQPSGDRCIRCSAITASDKIKRIFLVNCVLTISRTNHTGFERTQHNRLVFLAGRAQLQPTDKNKPRPPATYTTA